MDFKRENSNWMVGIALTIALGDGSRVADENGVILMKVTQDVGV